jgi:diaminopropionate ammonia-lyase
MLTKNPYKGTYKLTKQDVDTLEYHRSLKFMKETPLHKHDGLAKRLGIKSLYIKDEGQRTELKAFKILGVSYALPKYIEKHKLGEDVKFCGTTEGNHGRALAFMCREMKKECTIFVPYNTSKARIAAIEKYGAKVIQTDKNYDVTLEICAEEAKKNGWVNVSDTSFKESDTEIPSYIMEGYTTIFRESELQMEGVKPTHIFAQAGVGGLAGAAAFYYHGKEHQPVLICVEPTEADCYMQSVLNEGKRTPSKGNLNSIMNGLNCGIPSYYTFPWIMNEYSYMLTISREQDEVVKQEMRYLNSSEPKVVVGEAGVAGITGLVCLAQNEEWRKQIGLDENSVVLVVNSEGDTDQQLYQDIINNKL